MKQTNKLWIIGIVFLFLISLPNVLGVYETDWYNGFYGTIDAGNNHNNIPLNTAGATISTTRVKNFNSSYSLATTNDYFVNESSNLTTGNHDISVAFWVWLNSSVGAGNFYALSTYNSSTADYKGAYYGWQNDVAELRIAGDSVSVGGAGTYSGTGKWMYFVWTYKSSTKNASMYYNGTYVGSGIFTNTPLFANPRITIGKGQLGVGIIGYVSDVRVYDGIVLSQANVTTLYNGGNGLSNSLDGSSIVPSITFITPTNNSYIFSNGTAQNITFNWSTTSVELGSGQNLNGALYKDGTLLKYFHQASDICIGAYCQPLQISGTNVYVTVTDLTQGAYTVYLSGTSSTNASVTVTSGTNNFYVDYGNLVFTAKNYTGGTINTFTVQVNGTAYNTTTGTLTIPKPIGSYYALFNTTGYAYANTTINLTNSSTSYQFTLYPSNSIFFNTYNENTGARLGNQTTIQIVNNDYAYNLTMNNTGQGQVFNVTAGTYTITGSNPSFQNTQTQITVVDGYSYTTNLYFNNGTAILFNYRDYGSRVIEGVSLNIYTYINGVLTNIGNYLSDVTGKTQFYADTNKYYYFVNSKDGYQTYSFDLNPIRFTSYDIPLSTDSAGTVTPTAVYTYDPKAFYSGQSTNFSITFTSPNNAFTSYQYNLTYPGGSLADSGTSGGGATFIHPITISSSSTTATLTYTWLLNNGATQSDTITFTVYQTWQNKTFMNMGEKSYGMLIGDKVFWYTLIMLIVMGAGYLAIGSVGAILFGGILTLIMVNNGFFTTQYAPIFYAFGFGLVIMLIFRGGNK